MRGALVLFEGLPPTVIDSQVLTHVRLVREHLGIDIRVIAFACTTQIFTLAQARLEQVRQIANGPVHLFRGVRPGFPGSGLINRRRLATALDAEAPLSFLHVRGDYAAAAAGKLARRRRLPMLWDCRGDSHAEAVERRHAAPQWKRPLLTVRSWISQKEAQAAGRDCSAVCFVSEPLRDLMAPYIGQKPNWVLPCLANEDEFFFDPALRKATRKRLGIADNDVIYIYSGSLAGYQNFGEVVECFPALVRRKPSARLIVLTPATGQARLMMSGLPADRIICTSVAYSDVNDYLNAADFGFLLRDRIPVNQVAFPTKFAEYALAGLKIVMKDDPPSCIEVARKLGIYVPFNKIDTKTPDENRRVTNAMAAKAQMGRQANIGLFSDIYQTLARHTDLSAS